MEGSSPLEVFLNFDVNGDSIPDEDLLDLVVFSASLDVVFSAFSGSGNPKGSMFRSKAGMGEMKCKESKK
jgi:hypothetical protein